MKRKNILSTAISGMIAFTLVFSAAAMPLFASDAKEADTVKYDAVRMLRDNAASDTENGIFIEMNSEIPEGHTLVMEGNSKAQKVSDEPDQTVEYVENPFDFVDEEARVELLSAAKEFPETFDQRKVDTDNDGNYESYVTSVKFQNPFGTCWGFGAISAAETSILGTLLKSEVQESDGPDVEQKTIDLSEKHLTYFANKYLDDPTSSQNGEGSHNDTDSSASGIYSGGTTFLATSVFSQGIGPVTERNDAEETDEIMVYHGKDKKIELRYLYNAALDQHGYFPFCYSADDDWNIPEEYRHLQNYVLTESSILPTPAEKDILENYTYNEAATAVIKDELMKLHGVEIAFCADTSTPDPETKEAKYLNEKTWSHYTWDSQMPANHAVQIVGWDDNYSKDNFVSAHKPPADGAWLVKNSWGAGTEEFPYYGSGNWGIQVQKTDKEGNPMVDKSGDPIMVGSGYFWISYYDTSLTMIETFVFDKANTDEGYYLDEHDYMPASRLKTAVSEQPVKMSNIFEAEENKELHAVSFVTSAPGTEVKVEVYLLRNSAESPEDGVLAASTTTDAYTYGGFHKLYLNDFENLNDVVIQKDAAGNNVLPVQKGQTYSVIVTQKQPDEKYGTLIAFGFGKNSQALILLNNTYQKGVINKGESMLWLNGEWQDLSEQNVQCAASGMTVEKIKADDMQFDNFPIKGFCSVKPAENDVQMLVDLKSKLFMFEGQDSAKITLRFAGNAAAHIPNPEISWNLAEGGKDIVDFTVNENGVTLKAKKTGSTEMYVTVKGIGTTVIPVIVGAAYLQNIVLMPQYYAYTGQPIVPTIMAVSSNSKFLTEGIDYTLNLTDNVNVGVGVAEITPSETYKNPDAPGPIKYHFVITPPKTEVLKTETGEKTVKLTVSDQKDLGITGYAVKMVEEATGEEKFFEFEPDSNELLLEGLNPETAYTIQAASFVGVPEDIAALEGLEQAYLSEPSDEVKISTTGHIWNDFYTVETPVTYDHAGSESIHCSECGEIKPGSERSIAKLEKKNIAKASVSGIKTKTYTGKALTQKMTVSLNGNALKEGTDYEVFYSNNKYAGTAVVVIAGIGDYTGTAVKAFTIKPAKNTLKAKGKKANVKAAKLKKKAQTIKVKKAVAVSKAQGKVTYKLASVNKAKFKKYFKVAKNGKITVKKGLKKGTYKLKLKVTAAGNNNYKKAVKTVTVTVNVK